jgi:hypothetical protein
MLILKGQSRFGYTNGSNEKKNSKRLAQSVNIKNSCIFFKKNMKLVNNTCY